jgi:AraC-like DNA-binding protein
MPPRTARASPPESMLGVGPTMGLPDVLTGLGFNAREVLSEAGFAPGLFDDPDNVIPYAARGRLFAYCVEKTGCQHFGLLVGQHGGLHSLGLIGLLVKFSPDVGTALRNLVSHFHLHFGGAALSLQVEGGAAILAYRAIQPGSPATDHVGDGAVAEIFNDLRELCGPDWRPMEAWFAHREPADVEPYRRFFRVALRFDAEKNAIVFSSSWLKRPLPEVHPDVRRLLRKQVDALEARHGGDFPEQVRAILPAALTTGFASAERVAALFSMHPRTFNRRLNAFGVSYHKLADDIRFEMARQMLNDSNLQVSAIAQMLHYADARSFIRAFRRWSNETPAHWRARQMTLRRAALVQSGRGTASRLAN